MSLHVGTLFGYLELEDNLTPALKLSSQNLVTFGDKLDNVGKNVSKLGSALLPMSVAITAGATASSVFSANFEASMTRLVSIAGVGADELAGVRKEILDMAPAVGIGPQALADAMTKVSSTVSDTGKAMSILKIAAQGTKAGFGETIDVAGALTTVLNSYADTNITAARAGDILAMAVKEGGAEAKELAPTLANVVPFAAQLGVSFEEVAANIATLTKLGVPTAEAVTSLTSVFSALSKETKQGSEALAAMKDPVTGLGMSYEGLRKQIKDEGLAATLTDLKNKFGDNVSAMTDVFGRLEAVKNLMGTAGVQAETYATVLDRIKKSSDVAGGSLQNMADAMSGKQIQNWNELRATIEVLAIKFGDALAPALGRLMTAAVPVLNWIKDAVEWFGQLPQPLQTAGLGMLAFGAAIGPVLWAAGQMISSVGTIATVFGKMGLAASASAGPLTTVAGAGGLGGVGTAAKASGLLVGGFTAGLAAIVVPLALEQVIKLYDHLAGLFKDQQQWKLDDKNEIIVHMQMLAAASKIAGRDITVLAEAEKILRDEAGKLRDINLAGGVDGMAGGVVKFNVAIENLKVTSDGAAITVERLDESLKKGTEGATNGAAIYQTFAQQLEASRAALVRLTDAQQLNITAGIDLGISNDKIAESMKLSEGTVNAFAENLKKIRAEAEGLTSAWLSATEALSRNLFGADTIKNAELYVDVIKDLSDVSKMTADSQMAVQKAMLEGMEAMALAGRTTDDLNAKFLALYLKTVQLGVGATNAFDAVRAGASAADQAVKDFTEHFDLTGVSEQYRQLAKLAAAEAARTGLLVLPDSRLMNPTTPAPSTGVYLGGAAGATLNGFSGSSAPSGDSGNIVNVTGNTFIGSDPATADKVARLAAQGFAQAGGR